MPSWTTLPRSLPAKPDTLRREALVWSAARNVPATVTLLIPPRWTHGDELKSGALGPRSVVVHPTRDIVDYAPWPDSNGVVPIELRPRADEEGSRQHGDESLV